MNGLNILNDSNSHFVIFKSCQIVTDFLPSRSPALPFQTANAMGTVEPGRSLSYWWTAADGDEPASRVDVEIQAVGDVTRVWVRELRLDLDMREMPRAPLALSRG